MSGGYFDYQQYKIDQIADQVDQLIRTNNESMKDGFDGNTGRNYSEETINEFKKALDLLRKAATCAQRIDWLVSCDDSEETFLKRVKEDLEKH